jgi:CRP/FNR family transcriptional regulator, cyclic AMP receptor protein
MASQRAVSEPAASEPALGAIEDPVARELAARGQIRSFPKNAVLINEGERADSVFVLLSGRVKVFVSDRQGREMILDIRGAGQYVGEMTLDGGPRSASVQAMEAVSCAVVGRDALRAAIAADPDLAMSLIDRLIERARNATETVKSLALTDVYGRVSRLLLSLARERDGKLVVPERMTQQDIADRVGASRDMISRIFKDLTAGGYVSVVDRQITLNRRPPARW